MSEVYIKGYTYFFIIMAIVIISCKIWLYFQYKKIDAHFARLAENRDKQRADDEFRRKIKMDSPVFHDLKNKCLKANIPEYRDQIYAEIHDDLVDIFGKDYRTKFDISAGMNKEAWGSSDYPAFWAINLALAKKGMANSHYTMIGYKLGQGDILKWQIEVLKKMESYMIKAHPELSAEDLKLCLQPKTRTVWSDIKMQNITIQSTMDVEGGRVLCKRFCPNGRRLW